MVFRGTFRHSSGCGFVAFLAVLGSDLGGVWPFRIHCRQSPFLSLSRLGCADPTCFGTCLSSGLQICNAGRYFFFFLFVGSVGDFQGLADLQCWTLFFLFLFVGSVGDVSAFFAPTVSSRFWSFWARI